MDRQDVVKGLNNQPCIGPCLPKDTVILHPIYLYPITDHDHKPFCPTFEWTNELGKRFSHDTCTAATIPDKINKKDLELLYAIPNFGFDCEQFLKNYYDLYSFESVTEWLYSENNNLNTKLRVMNCAFAAFGNNSYILNDQLIDFYIEIIKKLWINDIYTIIYQYITVTNNNIYFKKNDDNKKDNKIEKINFFLDKFVTRSTIYNVLKNFLEINKSNWKDIKNYNNELKKYYMDHVLNKIKTAIKK